MFFDEEDTEAIVDGRKMDGRRRKWDNQWSQNLTLTWVIVCLIWFFTSHQQSSSYTSTKLG